MARGEIASRHPDDGEPAYDTLRVGAPPAMYGETPLPASGHPVEPCMVVRERVARLRDADGIMVLVIQDGT
jgi:lactoylglutathione lyase